MKQKSLTELLAAMTAQEEKLQENKTKKYSGNTREGQLKLEVGKSYGFLLLPQENGKIFEVWGEHGFTSKADNSYQFLGRNPSDPSLESPAPKNPIKKAQYESYNKTKEHPDKAVRTQNLKLLPNEKRAVNIFMVKHDDPAQNFTNKVLVFGSGKKLNDEPKGQIWSKLHDALFGENAQLLAPGLLSLDDNPQFIKIDVKEKTDGTRTFPDYNVQFFNLSGLNKLKYSDKERAAQIANTYDLSTFVPEIKTDEELTAILDEHWRCISVDDESDNDKPVETSAKKTSTPTAWEVDDDDIIPDFNS